MISSGDLLFYEPHGQWYTLRGAGESLICKATHGPYYHVEIALGADRAIGAYASGIIERAIPHDEPFTILSIAPYALPRDVLRAVSWAELQVGKEYGWSDIAFQAIKFLFPNNPLRWGIDGHWDCSDFVTRYLMHAGVQIPDPFLDPYSNTPNDIARMFGLLPSKFPRVPKIGEDAS